MHETSVPPDSHKAWARHLRSLLGGACAVTAYHDDSGHHQVHVFTSTSDEGIVAASLGLQDIDQDGQDGAGLYTEIIMDRRGADERLANVLASAMFFIIKDGWRIRPGTVFESVVEMVYPGIRLPHLMFTSPFQWDGMGRVELAGKTIHPLLALPISEAERRIARAHAGADLEDLWERRGIDVLDWSRPGTV